MVAGYLQLEPRIGRVDGSTLPSLGGAVLLGFSDRWRIGGSAHLLARAHDLDRPEPLPAQELRAGYGGVLIEWSATAAWALRLLVGAGNGEIFDSATGSRVRSDNFFLVEPSFGLDASVADRIRVGGTVAYRRAIGVQGLGNVDEASLSGIGLGLVVRLGPF